MYHNFCTRSPKLHMKDSFPSYIPVCLKCRLVKERALLRLPPFIFQAATSSPFDVGNDGNGKGRERESEWEGGITQRCLKSLPRGYPPSSSIFNSGCGKVEV